MYKRQVSSVAVPDAVTAVPEIVWKEESEMVSAPALAATPAAAFATLTFVSVKLSVPVAETAVPETLLTVTVSSFAPPPERTTLPLSLIHICIIPALKEKGYKFVTVSQMMQIAELRGETPAYLFRSCLLYTSKFQRAGWILLK